MTWHGPGALVEHPGGKKRDGVEVTCDAPQCDGFEILGWHGGSVEKIQRLLVARGWDWTDVVDGARDLCPKHASPAEQVAS